MADFEFTKITDVPEIEELQDNDTVLAIRDGELYRVAKDAVGGAGGYLLSVADNEVTMEDSSNLYITTPCQEAIDALRAGGNVTIAFNVEKIDEEFAGYGLCYMTISNFFVVDGSAMGLSGEIILGFGLFFGEPVAIGLTNGQEIPSDSSLSALSSKLGGGESVVG